MASSRYRAGQSLLEVLIAVAILAMMATGSFALVGVTVAESQIAAEQADARNLAEEGLEAARQIRNSDFALLAEGTHGLTLTGGTWSFAGASDTSGQYTRTVTITQIDENQRDVRVSVAWEARPGRTLTYTESTRFANWVNAPIPSASNCKSEGSTTGDWTHPVVLGSADIGSGNQGTDVVVKWPYVYMSGVAASSSKPDLFVFDATNTASPTIVKSIDTGADGINSLFLLGNYLYAASANNSKELMVFDVTTPSNPTLIGSSDLSGSEDGLTILAAESWVALGRANASSGEVYVYNVSTPAVPSLVGNFEVGADVNDLTTNGETLFAATSSTTKDVYMVNMANPVVPVELGSANLTSASADTTIAYHDPDTLFVGNAGNQLTVYHASSPPTLTLQSSYNTQGTVQDILCVIDNLIYTGTNYSTKEFQILNIANLAALSEYGSINFPQVATGVDFYNNMVFVSVRSNDALRIITSSP